MVVHLPPVGSSDDLAATVRQLRDLLRDLEAIQAGWRPSPADLWQAPVLEGWEIGSRTVPCLLGLVQGHPTLDDHRLIRTSEVWAIAPEFGYARTLSRLYRLGEQGLMN
ncbi:hypothetical protein DYI37_00080 [Fulvimarina endophytica]|uniref:Uncharacterized protein n=1 Tax=Fulvimarina endophytica TaxID=2293836 RepID=A0A371X9Q9_9HYPH|nr:DUF6634 family protein [Fulvimarina endophytica]RFC65932.1 hypothetical protein DYI37_00080 [Fulvimarina endophytica]